MSDTRLPALQNDYFDFSIFNFDDVLSLPQLTLKMIEIETQYHKETDKEKKIKLYELFQGLKIVRLVFEYSHATEDVISEVSKILQEAIKNTPIKVLAKFNDNLLSKIIHHSDKQFDLGFYFINHQKNDIGKQRAFFWSQKAAQQGNGSALSNVGWCYQQGFGVNKDETQAFYNFQKAADSGDEIGEFNLGVFYEQGIGVEKNEKEAFEHYLNAANRGLLIAQDAVGFCYKEGFGVHKDETQAFLWYQTAADLKYADAQYNLGFFYLEGKGTKKDEKKAFEYFQKAAGQGEVRAQVALGQCYERGDGVEKNEKAAVKWYEQAVNQNHASAKNNLGRCYEEGIGIEKDEKAAINWYQQAANQNHAEAFYHLGLCYEKGIGVVKDKKKAFECIQKSVALGDIDAMLHLGYYYIKGNFIESDEKKAYECFQMAAQNGSQLAKYWLNKEISFDASCVLRRIIANKNGYIPKVFSSQMVQAGPYCGLIAAASAFNDSGFLDAPVYASENEKKEAGQDISIKNDILLYQVVNIMKKSEKGEIYDVDIFSDLAQQYKIIDCRTIIKNECAEEEYTQAIFDEIKKGNVLVVACETKNAMPAQINGKFTHWVEIRGAWVEGYDIHLMTSAPKQIPYEELIKYKNNYLIIKNESHMGLYYVIANNILALVTDKEDHPFFQFLINKLKAENNTSNHVYLTHQEIIDHLKIHEPKIKYSFAVLHHGLNVIWKGENLAASNHDMPLENPCKKGENLAKFRNSFFVVPQKDLHRPVKVSEAEIELLKKVLKP